MIWNCTALAKEKIENLTKNIDPNDPPGLGIIQVGNDPASCLYVKIKQETAIKMGMKINIQTFQQYRPSFLSKFQDFAIHLRLH